MKKLYEFTAVVSCGYVVAADNEDAARKAVETFEHAWFDSGDIIGVSDVKLVCVTDNVDQDCLEDLSHEVV